MTVVASLNQKGGVGKTTTAINLAAAIAEKELSVAVVDMDPSADAMGFELGNPGVAFELATPDTLANVLQKHADKDFIIIDTPPTLGPEIAEALKSADLALVNINSEKSAMKGFNELRATINAARAAGNHLLKVKILITMFDTRSGHCRHILSEAQRLFTDDVFGTQIRRSYVFADAQDQGESILTYAKNSPGAIAYRAIGEEVISLG